MPGRPHPLITGNIYHVYNRSIEKRIVFTEKCCNLFIKTAQYYRSYQSTLRFSNFQKLSPSLLKSYEKRILDKRTFRVTILAYCLMPTHYHLLIKQNQDNGISFFISQLQNSFTRFYNIKLIRTGPIFLEKFKSKPITSEEQIKHVSRYIHLNPYSGGLIKSIEKIKSYSHSSFMQYLHPIKNNLCDPRIILSLFNENRERYKQFVLSNAEHQKTLEYCKYSNA